ncbi:SGNH/GDSL hydrolase family protein [Psychroflexus tropicus]|uniref:SGNH/GDSL hydrolase family protein n=1 Tax=Psychroflexus tropicus TaxID=197345 RepID=UPI00037ADC4E|nr:SGNH/GDSL hydrolase family protein [Psychroflexus tropicus]
MSTNATSQDSISYLALGDSYTIGEQVVENQSWPFQLTSYLNDEGFKVKSPEIIAVTGWRTDELQDSIAVQNYKDDQFDLVSLLIGVNNQYQKKPFKQFKVEFEELLKNAIIICSHQAKGVFVVGIPDYSLSKYARDEKLKGVTSKLKRYNRYIKKMCQRHGVAFYPLQQLSRPLHRKTEMLAEDFLHPSGKQYRVWVDSFKDQVKNQVESF